MRTPNSISMAWLELTNKCNLECNHCYASSTPREDLFGSLTKEDWINAIRELGASGCRHIQFIGGEPTLHPHLPEFIQECTDAGISSTEVYTNAISTSGELIDAFTKHKTAIATSIYGDRADAHDKMTNRKGSYRRTLKNIKLFCEANLEVRVGVILQKESSQIREAITKILEEIGVSSIKFDRVRGLGRGNDIVAATDPKSELCGRCGIGRITIDANGDIYPCVFSKMAKLGNLRLGINNVFNNVSHMAFLDTMVHDDCNPNCRPGDDCGPDCAPADDCAPQNRKFEAMYYEAVDA